MCLNRTPYTLQTNPLNFVLVRETLIVQLFIPKGLCHSDLNFRHHHKLIKGDVQFWPVAMNGIKSIRWVNGVHRVKVHLSI
jgi:hypothetical protein